MTDIQLPLDFNIDAHKKGIYDHLLTGKKWRLTCTDYGWSDIIKFRKALYNACTRNGVSGHAVIINDKELFFQARRKRT